MGWRRQARGYVLATDGAVLNKRLLALAFLSALGGIPVGVVTEAFFLRASGHETLSYALSVVCCVGFGWLAACQLVKYD